MKSLGSGSSHVQHRPPSVALLLQQEIGSGPHLGCCLEPGEDTLLVSAQLDLQLSAVCPASGILLVSDCRTGASGMKAV